MFNEAEISIIRGIRAAVAERGRDWTYPARKAENKEWYGNEQHVDGQCVNLLHDKTGACIVGTGAVHADMYIERRWYLERFTGLHRIGDAVEEALRQAQTMQDRGDTWGECLDAFEKALGIKGVKV